MQLGAGRVAQVVEHLPYKHAALTSNTNVTKKKKNASMGHEINEPYIKIICKDLVTKEKKE
jgi:hypothetical protein